jgi:DNA-binding PadR family transcriptional regulator
MRDHSTYELAKQMQLSLHYFWPRAESNVYAEPKRLVAAGLARARQEQTGARSRTIYSITKAGRRALSTWLASPSGRSRYESEALLKVFFAENAGIDELLESIRALRDEAADAIEHFQAIVDRYECGEGNYPERFALSALVARLSSEHHAATLRWATWAEELVSTWQSPTAPGVPWGIELLRAVGEPLGDDDPVRDLMQGRR